MASAEARTGGGTGGTKGRAARRVGTGRRGAAARSGETDAGGHDTGPAGAGAGAGPDAAQQTAFPFLAQDIAAAAFPDAPASSALRSLAKPMFAPGGQGLFLTGTEEQDPSKAGDNKLVFARIDFDAKCLASRTDGLPAVWTHNVSEHVRDIHWMDATNAVIATNQALSLVHVQHQDTDSLSCEVVSFPEFHTDCIREIAINPNHKNLVLSGGFDGNVFVTDLLQVAAALDGQSSTMKNTLYPGDGEVIGSVNWLPTESNTASATTDAGCLHIFDIRSHLNRAALLYDVGKQDLFGHCYLDDVTVVMGFGDGSIQVHDIRKMGCLQDSPDPYQDAVGDVRWGGQSFSRSAVVTCGHPGVSVWVRSPEGLTLSGNLPVTAPGAHGGGGLTANLTDTLLGPSGSAGVQQVGAVRVKTGKKLSSKSATAAQLAEAATGASFTDLEGRGGASRGQGRRKGQGGRGGRGRSGHGGASAAGTGDPPMVAARDAAATLRSAAASRKSTMATGPTSALDDPRVPGGRPAGRGGDDGNRANSSGGHDDGHDGGSDGVRGRGRSRGRGRGRGRGRVGSAGSTRSTGGRDQSHGAENRGRGRGRGRGRVRGRGRDRSRGHDLSDSDEDLTPKRARTLEDRASTSAGCDDDEDRDDDDDDDDEDRDDDVHGDRDRGEDDEDDVDGVGIHRESRSPSVLDDALGLCLSPSTAGHGVLAGDEFSAPLAGHSSRAHGAFESGRGSPFLGTPASSPRVQVDPHTGIAGFLSGSSTSVVMSLPYTNLRISSHHRAAGLDFSRNPQYKISGAFVPGLPYFAAADSVGSILVLDVSPVVGASRSI